MVVDIAKCKVQTNNVMDEYKENTKLDSEALVQYGERMSGANVLEGGKAHEFVSAQARLVRITDFRTQLVKDGGMYRMQLFRRTII